MNKTARWAFVATLLPLAACADKPQTPPAPAVPQLSSADAAFVQTMSEANLLEIALANAAATSAKGPKVKEYASHLLSDHTANQEKLKEIATSHGVTLPTTLSDADQATVTKMSAEKGHKFDHDYVSAMIKGHSDLLPQVQQEASTTPDDTLKAYATDTATAVQAHLDAGKALVSSHGGHHHGGHKKAS